MPSVTLEQLWIHNGTNYSNSIAIDVDAASEQALTPASVRRYAGGRLRIVTRPGTARELSYKALQVSRANVDQLRTWAGTFLMFRDPRGRIVWGMYPEIGIVEINAIDLADLEFTVESVTYDAAV